MTKNDDNGGTREKKLMTIIEEIGPEFVEHGGRRMTREDLEAVLRDRDRLTARVREFSALSRFEKEVALAIALLRDHRSGAYRIFPFWSLGIITFALQYVLKPVDIIPDVLPEIGQLDDAAVLSHGLAMVTRELHAYKVWKMANRLAEEDGNS